MIPTHVYVKLKISNTIFSILKHDSFMMVLKLCVAVFILFLIMLCKWLCNNCTFSWNAYCHYWTLQQDFCKEKNIFYPMVLNLVCMQAGQCDTEQSIELHVLNPCKFTTTVKFRMMKIWNNFIVTAREYILIYHSCLGIMTIGDHDHQLYLIWSYLVL